MQLRDLYVVKADSRRVPFERDKLARSVRIALRKRPVDDERIERIVNGLVRKLEASGETDIPSVDIGKLVMDTLREVDIVAYIRFASVHWDFRETKDFAAILDSIPGAAEARAAAAGGRKNDAPAEGGYGPGDVKRR
ncbi:hypothetical protein GCM10023157_06950 [Gluconacetobacter asukensis]